MKTVGDKVFMQHNPSLKKMKGHDSPDNIGLSLG